MALRTEWRWARWSLVAVWLWTAVASAVEADGVGLALLGDDVPRALKPLVIWSGAAVDLLLGLALLLAPGPRVYGAALAMMTLMTLIGTWIDPALWLHPLGPLLKNLPIAALLWLLIRHDHPNREDERP